MSNLNKFLFSYIIFSIILQYALTDEIPQIGVDTPYTSTFQSIDKEAYLSAKINKPVNNNSTLYLQFRTSPLTQNSLDAQQIIYSSEKEKPSTKDTDEYSFRYYTNADLAVFAPSDTDTIYLTIKCLKYPCSFNFDAKMIENYINLTLVGTHDDFYFYSSNSLGKEKLNKINFTFPVWDKKNLDIAVNNPGDLEGDFITLSYAFLPQEGEIVPIHVPIEERTKFEKGIIFSINEGRPRSDYFLEIESSENQFITLSIKTFYNKSNNYYESEIIPNTNAKYSKLAFESNINECFEINKDYINNFLNNNQQTSFLFSSIEFLSLPINVYLNYSNTKKYIQNSKINNYLNVIIQKENNEYPKICFEKERSNLESAFSIEISHLYSNMENIDIYSPIFSGFYNQKTLMADSLGVYTHNSDIHFVQKISFYLKPLKGKPEIYIYQCDDYPNCPNKIDDLKKANPDKAQDFGNFQFYSKQFDRKAKDLSPYGYSQNLLYVYCPSNTEDGYCQFEILIYSDLDEIVLEENKDFNAMTTKDDELRFKIVFKKGHDKLKDINFCLNADEKDIEFNTFEDINNCTIAQLYIDNKICYKYIPDEQKLNNLNNNDIEIIFNIKSKSDMNYTLENFLVKQIDTKGIGEIISEPEFSFPYELNYLINNTNSDLLFNIFLNDVNQTFNFDNIEIGVMILNDTYLTYLQKKGEISILDRAKKEKLEQATRTAVLYIKKEEIKDIIGEDIENKYYLHFVFINNDQTINQELTAKMFLLEKQIDEQYVLDNNIFINNRITFDNSNIINLYHLKMENNTILGIKFSSNYQIDDKFSVYLIDYHADIKIDIDYLENNKKNFIIEQIGQMYTLFLDNNNSNLDITFAVVSKLVKDNIGISNINYMFKYNIYSNEDEYHRKTNYIFNENFTLTEEEEDKTIFEFDSITKNGTQLNNEIYIRKILEKDLLPNESISTFAKIESKYEMIEGTKYDSNGKIRIEVPKIIEENCSFSILVDIPNENEKFVISNKIENDTKPIPSPTDIPSEEATEEESNSEEITEGESNPEENAKEESNYEETTKEESSSEETNEEESHSEEITKEEESHPEENTKEEESNSEENTKEEESHLEENTKEESHPEGTAEEESNPEENTKEESHPEGTDEEESNPEENNDGGDNTDNTTDDSHPSNDTSDDKSPPDDDSLILKIVIPIAAVILVLGIVFLILYLKKRKGGELKQKILKTSFQEGENNEESLIKSGVDD